MKKLLLSSLIIVNCIFASYGQMEKNDTIKSNQFLYCEIVGESNLLQTKVRAKAWVMYVISACSPA